jgi:hypothetical protein
LLADWAQRPASCISYGVALNRPSHDLKGRGPLYRGDELLDVVDYTVQTNFPADQGTVVVFDSRPPANDGDVVRLTLEDGRIVVCRILDDSPYCSVIGEGPRAERRRRPRG